VAILEEEQLDTVRCSSSDTRLPETCVEAQQEDPDDGLNRSGWHLHHTGFLYSGFNRFNGERFTSVKSARHPL
jgi:hypothetical protein